MAGEEGLEVEVLDPQVVAERIGWSVEGWPGACYAVASMMVKHGVVDGKPEYGHYLGSVMPGSMFFGKPIIQHGWVRQEDGTVIDPTRFVFFDEEPSIAVIGPADPRQVDYDMSGTVFRMRNLKPPPKWDEGDQQVDATVWCTCPPNTTMADCPRSFVYGLLGGALPVDQDCLTVRQCFWLANLPLVILDGHAAAIFYGLHQLGLRGFVPIDNWRHVMG